MGVIRQAAAQPIEIDLRPRLDHYLLVTDATGEAIIVDGEPATVLACDQGRAINPAIPPVDDAPRCLVCTALVESGAVS